MGGGGRGRRNGSMGGRRAVGPGLGRPVRELVGQGLSRLRLSIARGRASQRGTNLGRLRGCLGRGSSAAPQAKPHRGGVRMRRRRAQRAPLRVLRARLRARRGGHAGSGVRADPPLPLTSTGHARNGGDGNAPSRDHGGSARGPVLARRERFPLRVARPCSIVPAPGCNGNRGTALCGIALNGKAGAPALGHAKGRHPGPERPQLSLLSHPAHAAMPLERPPPRSKRKRGEGLGRHAAHRLGRGPGGSLDQGSHHRTGGCWLLT